MHRWYKNLKDYSKEQKVRRKREENREGEKERHRRRGRGQGRGKGLKRLDTDGGWGEEEDFV